MDELKQKFLELSPSQRREFIAVLMETIAKENRAHLVNTIDDPIAVGSRYVARMNAILGINILDTDRHRDFIWGRNCVIWQMGIDGFTEKQIASVIPLTHSTICNSRKKMRAALQYPGTAPFANELYNKFTASI